MRFKIIGKDKKKYLIYSRCIEVPSIHQGIDTDRRSVDTFHCGSKCIAERKRCPKYLVDTAWSNLLLANRADNGIHLKR